MIGAAAIPLRSAADIDPAKVLPTWRTRITAPAAFSLGFFAFLPYPAIPAGNNSAVQIGTLITLPMVLPIFLVSWRRRPFYLYPLLLVPLVTSVIKVAVLQQPGLESSIKAVITTSLPCLTLLPAIFYAPRYSLQMMTGIAAATILHVLVGCWQEYVFINGGEFPLLWIYVNPSFYSVVDQGDFVLYEQRPFGLFSEPSAMSSSLAPWVLIWIAEMCGLIRFASRPSGRQRMFFRIAAIGALALIISSRSGHAMATLAAVLLFGVAWAVRARATVRNYLATVSVFGLVLPLMVWLTVLALSDRVAEASGMNQSWQDRSDSLILGFKIWIENGWRTLLFGIGVGLSASELANQHGLDAVWSVLLTYLYETGLIGGAVIVWFGVYLARVWKACRYNVVFGTVTLVWVIGITITTSYGQLLPIWLTLGFLIVWPDVFAGAASDQARKRMKTASSHAEREPEPTKSAGEKGLGLTPWAQMDLSNTALHSTSAAFPPRLLRGSSVLVL